MHYACKLSQKLEKFVVAVIVVNAISLGLETSPAIYQKFGFALELVDKICLAIFSFEILLKIVCQRLNYFKSGWNIFDFIIVGISFLPTTGGFAVLRSLRVLRLFLLITAMPRLKIMVRALILSLPNIASISLLMVLLFYVAGVMATKLFGAAFPDWFGSLSRTLFTLFQIMTLESWAMGIVRPVSQQFPYAFLFFVPFVLLSSFIVLNIFIAVIINGINDAREHYDKVRKMQELISRRPERGAPKALDAQKTQELRQELEKLSGEINRIMAQLK